MKRIVLAGIVLAACLLSAYWAFRVPLLQEPDETSHLDYVLALFDVGRPFRVDAPVFSYEATPELKYLKAALDFRRLRYNASARVPPSYGTAAHFNAIDAGAPRPAGVAPRPGSDVPYAAFGNPVGYYALEAFVLAATYALTRGSLITGLFADRLCGAAMLAVTLAFGYRFLRLYGLRSRHALAATACIALFPLTTVVSSSVQPDNLTWMLTTIALAFAAGIRYRPPRAAGLEHAVPLALTIGILAFVKPYYSAAILVAVIVAVAPAFVTPRLRESLASLAVLCGLPAICSLLATRMLIVPHWHVGTNGARVLSSHADLAGSHSLSLIVDALRATYLPGNAFFGFWATFGWNTKYLFGRGAFGSSILTVIGVLTLFLLAALAVISLRDGVRIARIAAAHRLRKAAALFGADLALNAYVVWTLFLGAANVATDGVLILSGRYWLPVLFPLAALILQKLPSALARAHRHRARVFCTSVALGYSLLAASAGPGAIARAYYGPQPPVSPAEPFAGLLAVDGIQPHELTHATLTVVTASGAPPVHVSGWAIDSLSGRPAQSITYRIDDLPITTARYRLRVPGISALWQDDIFKNAGFTFDVPTKMLAGGTHRLSIFVGEPEDPQPRSFPMRIFVRVTRSDLPGRLRARK